ncbi:NADPH-dependent F420 reductase [Kineococcus gynurae]|uniref:NADPH-dependent F420 reductase n=1 Tax=Kineococcus gynurae TaxID=452979 RepID=A0ABV5LX12_9ACTN
MSTANQTVTTLGIIGAGNIGSTVARLALDAGIDVVIANSRGPETLTELIDELGDRARAATAEEAAEAGDVVVVTVPFRAYRDLPVETLVGKVVLDTNNYYPDRDGSIPELDEHRTTTSTLVQEHLAGARVVKAFNSIFFVALAALARPQGDPGRSALPIFGDDQAALATATDVLDALGYDVVVGGSLAESWRAENGRPVYVLPYAQDGEVTVPAPADGAIVRRLLESAVRDDPAQQPGMLS